jgi:hypothetical protein
MYINGIGVLDFFPNVAVLLNHSGWRVLLLLL